MGNHPANHSKAMLVAWVDAPLRDHARELARDAGVEFSAWVEDAVRRASVEQTAKRAVTQAIARGECVTCGFAPCLCDQQ